MRDQSQTWTAQQERLLFAAQAIVNETEDGSTPDVETIATLRAVVKEISDDAEKALRAAATAACKVCGGALTDGHPCCQVCGGVNEGNTCCPPAAGEA